MKEQKQDEEQEQDKGREHKQEWVGIGSWSTNGSASGKVGVAIGLACRSSRSWSCHDIEIRRKEKGNLSCIALTIRVPEPAAYSRRVPEPAGVLMAICHTHFFEF